MNILKDLLFPKFCAVCGHLGSYICLSCQKKLIICQDRCIYCYGPSFFGLTHYRCQRSFGLDGVLSVYAYNLPLKKIIQSIKYRLATEVMKELLNVIPMEFLYKLTFFRKLYSEYFLQVIPLHKDRLKKRGFNQSDMIKNFFNIYLPAFFTIEDIERVKNTLPQAQIKEKKQKYINMKGSFILKKGSDVINKNIILIDDVATTGSTLKEACRILKKGGARKVFAITLAKG